MSERREWITYFGYYARANVVTKYGASTQTCLSTEDAMTFFASVRAKDAKRETKERRK
jgi:hypothetical protein